MMHRTRLALATWVLSIACASPGALSAEAISDVRSKVETWAGRIRASGAVSATYRHGDTSDYSWIVFDPRSGAFVVANPQQTVARLADGTNLWKKSPDAALKQISKAEQEGKSLDALLDPFMSGALVLGLIRDWDKWIVSGEEVGDSVVIRARYPQGMRYLACDSCDAKSPDETVEYTFTKEGGLVSTERSGHQSRPFESIPGDAVGLLTRSGDYPGAGMLVTREALTPAAVLALTASEIASSAVDKIRRPRETVRLTPSSAVVDGNGTGVDAEDSRDRRSGTAIAFAGVVVIVVAIVAWIRKRSA